MGTCGPAPEPGQPAWSRVLLVGKSCWTGQDRAGRGGRGPGPRAPRVGSPGPRPDSSPRGNGPPSRPHFNHWILDHSSSRPRLSYLSSRARRCRVWTVPTLASSGTELEWGFLPTPGPLLRQQFGLSAGASPPPSTSYQVAGGARCLQSDPGPWDLWVICGLDTFRGIQPQSPREDLPFVWIWAQGLQGCWPLSPGLSERALLLERMAR